MNKLLIGLSTAALIIATPALAQDTKAPANTGTQIEKNQPSTGTGTQPSTGGAAMTPKRDSSNSAAAPSRAGKYASAETYRASKLIGATVVNAKGDSIGNINDLLVDREGKVSQVVVGVGGFLGMGEHSVALGMTELSLGTNQNGSMVVSTSMTKDQLEALPAWKAPASKK